MSWPVIRRVIVIDDHALVREGLALLLRGLDPALEVVEAAGCTQALAALARGPTFDLALLDLDLPDMPGEQGLAQMRIAHPELAVVVVSARSDRETILRTIRAGAMGFIPKSHAGSVMQGALSFVLERRGIYLPPEVLLDDLRAAAPPPRRCAPPGPEPVRPQQLGLSARQADVLQLLLHGWSNRRIGESLGLTEATVKSHLTAVLRALNVTTRTEAVVAVNRLRLEFGDQPRSAPGPTFG